MSTVHDDKPQCEHFEDNQHHSADEKIGVVETPESIQLERRVKFKVDMFILPLTAIAYFLASMGRSDLGNAKVAGMTKDLGISDQQYSNIASMFYVGYVVFQLPATLALQILTPPVQMFLAMLLWGLSTTCLVVAKGYATVAGLRFLIGVAEAGVQGLVLFLALVYTPRELTKRIAFTFSTSALAGACNGLIVYGIVENLAGSHGWTWQWIFLVEGVIPLGFAFIILALYPSTPEKTRRLFFTADEKALIIRRSREAANTGEHKFRPQLLLKLFMDPIFWLLVCLYAGSAFALACLTNFLPAVIEGFGWSAARAQAMSIIPYAFGFVATNCWSQVADRFNQRGILIVCNMLLAIVGFIVLLTVQDRVALLVGCCAITAGIYPSIALGIAWIPILLPGHMFRASGVGLVNAFAQAASIAASQAYRNPAHDYREGHVIALSVVAVGACAAAILRLLVSARNKTKEEQQSSQEAEQMRQLTVDELGHKHPDFYFPC